MILDPIEQLSEARTMLLDKMKEIDELKRELKKTRNTALEDAAMLCERTRCREWTPKECAFQIRDQLMKKEGKP